MTKSELIERLLQRQAHMSHKDVELAVKLLLDNLVGELSDRGRNEIRGFGSFAVHDRPARRGRHPKTGAPVDIPRKFVPHFKPGKELRQRVNAGAKRCSGPTLQLDRTPAGVTVTTTGQQRTADAASPIT